MTLTLDPVLEQRLQQELEHFPCCWVSLERRAAAFSLRKTPIRAVALDYTYRENAQARGGYADPADFIAHALDLLEAEPATVTLTHEQEDWGMRHREAINRALDVSFAQGERGEFVTPEDVQARLNQRRAERASRAA